MLKYLKKLRRRNLEVMIATPKVEVRITEAELERLMSIQPILVKIEKQCPSMPTAEFYDLISMFIRSYSTDELIHYYNLKEKERGR